MKKMAIFVEGYTELKFVDRLIHEIANANAVTIVWKKILGGATCKRRVQEIRSANPSADSNRYILLFDCGNDDQVKTRMQEEYESLAKSGYSRILCIRDVHPHSPADLKKLEKGLPKFVKTSPIVVTFILSVMEIEAYFLAEHSHFIRVDSLLSLTHILAHCGFDPSTEDMQLRPNPASDIKACYSLVGKTYEKGPTGITVDNLDFAEVYLSLVDKFPYLNLLCAELSEFLG